MIFFMTNGIKKTDIEIHQQQWIVHDLCFCHDITDIRLPTPDSRQYFFCGHIHPAIHLSGTGKQSLRFPCFYFAKNYAVLPAFSRFTGTHLIDPGKNEVVFAIANENNTYLRNLTKQFNLRHGNEFSVRFIYFFDYNQFRRKK